MNGELAKIVQEGASRDLYLFNVIRDNHANFVIYKCNLIFYFSKCIWIIQGIKQFNLYLLHIGIFIHMDNTWIVYIEINEIKLPN